MKRCLNGMRFMIFSIMKFGRCWGMRLDDAATNANCSHQKIAQRLWWVGFKMVQELIIIVEKVKHVIIQPIVSKCKC